jgi:hypothetical protein
LRACALLSETIGVSQRFVFEEDYGWPAKVMRAVIWSGTMGVMWVIPWGVLVLAVLLYSNFWEMRHPSVGGEHDGIGWGLLFIGALQGAAVSFLAGGVFGLSAALEENPEQPFWPFASSRLRSSFRWVGAIILQMVLGAGAAVMVDFLPS